MTVVTRLLPVVLLGGQNDTLERLASKRKLRR